jgi:DNA repair ATPase RecN
MAFPNRTRYFSAFPGLAQKCAIGMAQNEQPYCSKVSNTVAQNCTSNQINKNNLRLNKINRTKEAYGRYRNVFLEDYSELEMEIAELDTLIEDLSAYMQSTGRKYADYAVTLRCWSARKKRQQKPGAGIPDYTYNKEESL